MRNLCVTFPCFWNTYIVGIRANPRISIFLQNHYSMGIDTGHIDTRCDKISFFVVECKYILLYVSKLSKPRMWTNVKAVLAKPTIYLVSALSYVAESHNSEYFQSSLCKCSYLRRAAA